MEKRYIPKNLRCKGKKKKLRAAAAAFAVCLVLFVFLIGVVIGRYQRQLQSDGSVKALDFYFTSDFLDGSTHTLAPGSTEVTFTLGNHADNLRFSEVDIEYTVTVDNGATVSIKNNTENTGTLAKGSVTDAEVTLSGLEGGKTYTVTATGKGGYEKSLTATIEVLSNVAQLYQHKEETPDYTLLTVWNEGETEGTVTIEYAGIPDNTNPNMMDWTTGGNSNKVTKDVKIAPHSSMVFRFFNATDITVNGATAKEPN